MEAVQQVTDLLNNEGPATKTVAQWKAVWRREKAEAKQAWLNYRRTMCPTGAGPVPGLQGRILSLCGLSSREELDVEHFDKDDSETPAVAVATGTVQDTLRVSVGDRPGTSGTAAHSTTPPGIRSPPQQTLHSPPPQSLPTLQSPRLQIRQAVPLTGLPFPALPCRALPCRAHPCRVLLWAAAFLLPNHLLHGRIPAAMPEGTLSAVRRRASSHE